MNILITQGKSSLAAALASHLSASHTVRLTDVDGSAGDAALTQCDLGHDSATDDLVQGIDAIIHIGYNAVDSGDPSDFIDYHTRRTYNLLTAASEAGVARCIYLSTLRLLEDYEENLTVTEKWRSLPPSEDPLLLSCHLGEIVCKEFARDSLIDVVTLRLGFPLICGDRQAAVDSGESAAVSIDDVFATVEKALTADIARWQDVHIQSPVPRQRFLMHAAGELLQYPSASGTEKGA